MKPEDVAKLSARLRLAIAQGTPGARVAIVGWTPAAFEIASDPALTLGAARLTGIFAKDAAGIARPLAELGKADADIVVVAEDAGKEPLLDAIAAVVRPSTRILIGGFGHFEYRDAIYDQVRRDGLIPSFANGYANCLVHIYQCLKRASALGLLGVVAEFGMFKGGTTMLISRFIEELGAGWKVFGFDTFAGFPAKRSALDMYDHPDCVYLDVDTVRSVFGSRNVEIVEGDVVRTVQCLLEEKLVLSFIDTDNHTSAAAILDVVMDRTLIGGAIVFDHWTGVDRHLDTIGERMAARRLAIDDRYFNLHGTGVFLRLA